MREVGITRIQWIALYYIEKHQPISPRELSKLMNVQDSSTTRLLERMESEDLIFRIPCESDKRVTLVSLTEKGKSFFERLISYGDQFNNDLISGISLEDLETFEQVLSSMLENINKKD